MTATQINETDNVVPVRRNGVEFDDSPISVGAHIFINAGLGHKRIIEEIISDHTIMPEESGTLFSNRAAHDDVILELPAPALGLFYGFAVAAAHLLTVNVEDSGTQSIVYYTSNSEGFSQPSIFSNQEQGHVIWLVALSSTQWRIEGLVGGSVWTSV